MSGTRLATLLIVGVTTLAGCEAADPLAPPRVYYGEDLCVLCRMIISDERFAAASIVKIDGRFRSRLYDDIGCLLADDVAEDAAALYVHDLRSLRWVPFGDATYVHSPELRTPMASGVAAAGSPEAARVLLIDYPGRLLDPVSLRTRHAAGELHVLPEAAGAAPSPAEH